MSMPWIDIAVATITGGATWGGLRYTVKKQRQDLTASNMRAASEFGQTMATTAFDSLKAQVDDFVAQQKLWQEERRDFIERIDKLTDQLSALQTRVSITNQYVHQLLIVLDQHEIGHPPTPAGMAREAT